MAGQRVIICKLALAIALHTNRVVGILSNFPEQKKRQEWVQRRVTMDEN